MGVSLYDKCIAYVFIGDWEVYVQYMREKKKETAL